MRIDQGRLRPAQAVDFAIAADARDLIAAHRDRFRHRSRGVGGIHLGVENNQVDRSVAVVALRTDDEAGDQGGSYDADDKVSSEAGGHALSGRGGT